MYLVRGILIFRGRLDCVLEKIVCFICIWGSRLLYSEATKDTLGALWPRRMQTRTCMFIVQFVHFGGVWQNWWGLGNHKR